MQTLTLKQKGCMTHLVLAPLSTAVVRDAPAPPLAGARHRTKPPLYRRDAGVCTCVLAQQSAVNGKLDGGPLTLRPRHAPPQPAPLPPPLALREKGQGAE
jgi:hypothetical protein